MRKLTSLALVLLIYAVTPCWQARTQERPIGDASNCQENAGPASGSADQTVADGGKCEGGGLAGAVGCVEQKIGRLVNPQPGGNRLQPPGAPTANRTDECQPKPACTGMELSYSRKEIAWNEVADAIVTHIPGGCRPPLTPIRFHLISNSNSQFDFLSPGSRRVEAGKAGSVVNNKNQEGAALVEVSQASPEHGIFIATASLVAAVKPKCEQMYLHIGRVYLGEWHEMGIVFEPEDCPQDMTGIRYSIIGEKIVYVNAETRSVFGKVVGETTIQAQKEGLHPAIQDVQVLNDGIACQQLHLEYLPTLRLDGKTTVREHTGQTPRLSYEPVHCRKPEGAPTFEEVTSGIVLVDRQTGSLSATRVGTATVAVRHGTLGSSSQISVVRKPDCNRLSIYYESFPLPRGAMRSPQLEWSNSDGVYYATELQNCYAPWASLQYSSSNPDVVTVNLDGKIEAHDPGEAIITVQAGDLPPAKAHVQVRERE